MVKTKAEVAQKIVEHLMDENYIIYKKDISDYSDLILDIQDILSENWDEKEIEE